MELPRVLHLFARPSWSSGRAARLLAANGRTLAVVVGDDPRPQDLPALTRRVPRLPGPGGVTTAALRAAGTRVVHAHDLAAVPEARRLAERLRRPWTATVDHTADPRRLDTASLVLVPDDASRQTLIERGLRADRVVAHGLGPAPEAGVLMAVLECHWVALLRSGSAAPIPRASRDLPTVTVLLATYQRRALLRRCLEHLARQTYPSDLIQVVVVDNGSTDGTADDLRALAEAGAITVVTTGEPVLVTEARNRALAAATGELVLFTDDDCRPVPEWVENIVTTWLATGQGIVQGRTTGDPSQPRGVSSRTQETPFGFGLFETCNIAYPREALGGRPFDDAIPERLRDILGRRFPPDPTGEDTDLGWRMREKGLPFAFSATALVHHEIFGPDPAYLVRRARMTAVFPVLVDRHPELRRSFLVGRVFLHKERPHWWLAAAAPVAALLWGAPALLAGAPYAWALLRPTAPGVRERARQLPVTLRVDALTSAALLRGSARTRTLVL